MDSPRMRRGRVERLVRFLIRVFFPNYRSRTAGTAGEALHRFGMETFWMAVMYRLTLFSLEGVLKGDPGIAMIMTWTGRIFLCLWAIYSLVPFTLWSLTRAIDNGIDAVKGSRVYRAWAKRRKKKKKRKRSKDEADQQEKTRDSHHGRFGTHGGALLPVRSETLEGVLGYNV